MKRFVTIVICILFILPAYVFLFAGSSEKSNARGRADAFFEEKTEEILPHAKEDGSPYQICYVDIDPYPASGEMLYFFVKELYDTGWISLTKEKSFEDLPFDPQNTDAGKLIDYLAEEGTGDYVSFSKKQNFYIAVDDIKDVKKAISHGVQKGDIDLILCLGTSPGELVIQEMGVTEVPVMVYFSVDPVASGLSETQEYSGKENVWCHTSSEVYLNQMKFYYDAYPFTNIGMVYYDESVAAMGMYRDAAKKLGVKITERQIPTLTSSDKAEVEQYYEMLKGTYEDMIKQDGIDAFLLNTDMIKDEKRIKPLLSLFYDADIPVFVQNGEFYVREGALMMMTASDAATQAPFAVDAFSQILGGVPPKDVYQKFVPSPFISLNLDSAEEIGYTVPEEILRSAEKIYSGE